MAEWRAINHRILQDNRVRMLDVPARYVYLATILLADDHGRIAWDSFGLAEWVDIPEDTVSAALDDIVRLGLVELRGDAMDHRWGVHSLSMRISRTPQLNVIARSAERRTDP
jgi:hypothetical protein